MNESRHKLVSLFRQTAMTLECADDGNSAGFRAALRMGESIPMFAHELAMRESARHPWEGVVPTRFEMAKLGWHIDESTTTRGWGNSVGYTVRVSRHDWHGDYCTKASYMASCTDIDSMEATYAKAVRLALRAWDEHRTPGCPPTWQGGCFVPDRILENIRAHLIKESPGDEEPKRVLFQLKKALDESMGKKNHHSPLADALSDLTPE